MFSLELTKSGPKVGVAQGWMSGRAFAHSLVASLPVMMVGKYLDRVEQLPAELTSCKVPTPSSSPISEWLR